MNETIQTILTRRSIRSFKEQPIAKEDLDLMIQAALHAPSGMGLQTWQFTVITNPEKIQSLAKAISSVHVPSGSFDYPFQSEGQPFWKRRRRLRSGKYLSGGSFPGDWLCLDQSASGNLRRTRSSRYFKRIPDSGRSYRLRHGCPGICRCRSF